MGKPRTLSTKAEGVKNYRKTSPTLLRGLPKTERCHHEKYVPLTEYNGLN